MGKCTFYKMFRPIFKFLFTSFYGPKIIGKENIPKSGAAVIAGNHKHALDPIMVDASTRRVVHTLAKKDLHDGRLGWFFRLMGSIPVDLHAEHNKGAFDSAVEVLKEGELINLSPEAKRNFTNEILLPFKYGAVVMAIRTGCDIIPYAITGDYRFRSKNLKIVYGSPLSVLYLIRDKTDYAEENTMPKKRLIA